MIVRKCDICGAEVDLKIGYCIISKCALLSKEKDVCGRCMKRIIKEIKESSDDKDR